MQEILSEFCRQYINQSPHAIKLVENYVVRKNRYRLLELEQRARGDEIPKREKYGMTDVDKDAIYDLLDETSPLGRGPRDEDEDI